MAATPARAQTLAAGGDAGFATGGFGNNGGAGGDAFGGGLYDDGPASFTGVTVNFTSNQALAGLGGSGGEGGNAFGGYGGTGRAGRGGDGGNATAGNGGNGNFDGLASGGGIYVDQKGNPVLKPRLGAKTGSRESKATDVITANAAVRAAVGTGGLNGGSVAAGQGGAGRPPGTDGTDNFGHTGEAGRLVPSAGGGITIVGTATADNTSVTGNTADEFPNIDGTLSS